MIVHDGFSLGIGNVSLQASLNMVLQECLHELVRPGSTLTASLFRLLSALIEIHVTCAIVLFIHVYLTLAFCQHVHGWD